MYKHSIFCDTNLLTNDLFNECQVFQVLTKLLYENLTAQNTSTSVI
jgi:hypothetical protein